VAVAAAQRMLAPALPQWGGVLVEGVGVSEQALGVIAMRVAGARAGAAGVLPFGLGRQPVAVAFGAAQPLRQGLGIVPGDVDRQE
jgi:hypothetical protein